MVSSRIFKMYKKIDAKASLLTLKVAEEKPFLFSKILLEELFLCKDLG